MCIASWLDDGSAGTLIDDVHSAQSMGVLIREPAEIKQCLRCLRKLASMHAVVRTALRQRRDLMAFVNQLIRSTAPTLLSRRDPEAAHRAHFKKMREATRLFITEEDQVQEEYETSSSIAVRKKKGEGRGGEGRGSHSHTYTLAHIH